MDARQVARQVGANASKQAMHVVQVASATTVRIPQKVYTPLNLQNLVLTCLITENDTDSSALETTHDQRGQESKKMHGYIQDIVLSILHNRS